MWQIHHRDIAKIARKEAPRPPINKACAWRARSRCDASCAISNTCTWCKTKECCMTLALDGGLNQPGQHGPVNSESSRPDLIAIACVVVGTNKDDRRRMLHHGCPLHEDNPLTSNSRLAVGQAVCQPSTHAANKHDLQTEPWGKICSNTTALAVM